MPKLISPEVTDRSIGTRISQTLLISKRYMTSYYRSHRERAWFQDVKTYCMFIGHARSGHSLIGALLDAHPNVILADEGEALRYISAGFNRAQIYHILLAKSQKQASKGRTKHGREEKLYSYHVPGQWQGRFSSLHVIGDSSAGTSTQMLAQNPPLLQHLQTTMMNVNVKLIHVIRNPYDVISTMILRGGRTYENAIERYFSNCETIVDIRKRMDSANVFAIKLEEFINHPEVYLDEICRFVGVEPINEYLNACTSMVYKSPAKSRYSVPWSAEVRGTVERKIDKFEFLQGYSYDS
jgi:hypothetical protein